METANAKDYEVGVELGEEIGMKRVCNSEEIELMVKKPRGLKFGVESGERLNNSSGDKECGSGVESDKKVSCAGELLGSGNLDSVKKDNLSLLDFDLNAVDVEDFGFDLNVTTLEAEECGKDIVSVNNLEVICIMSDDSDDDEVIVISEINRGIKSDLIENMNLPENYNALGLGFGELGGHCDVGGSSSLYGERRDDDEVIVIGEINRGVESDLTENMNLPENYRALGLGFGELGGHYDVGGSSSLYGERRDDDEVMVISEINRSVESDLTENMNLPENYRALGLGFGELGGHYDVGGSSSLYGERRDDDEVMVISEINRSVESDLTENMNLPENYRALGLGFGELGGHYDVGGSSSLYGGRRYTGDEKGKVKVDDSWLSLALYHGHFEVGPNTQESIEPRKVNTPALRIGELQHGARELQHEAQESTRANIMESATRVTMMGSALQKSELRRIAVEFARFNSKEHHSEATVLDENLGTGDGPFSVALKNVREQKSIQKNKSVIQWRPSGDSSRKCSVGAAPSLLELSLKVLAENAASIVSVEGIPYILRRRLSDLICNLRSMNAHTLDVFAKGSPTEICIKDCHWLTEDQLSTAFGNSDLKNLVVLQLELCGQCNFDYVMGKTFAVSLNSLPNLTIVSLKGASRLSDAAVETLVRSAPTLQSINLSQCSLLTEKCISIIADSVGPTLKELYIDECQIIHAKRIETAVSKLKILEVLSVAGIQTVCDKFVEHLVSVCGKTIKELNLADCPKLTNYSLEVIASTCSSLHSLNISKLYQLTDMSLQYLANGCRLIQSLTLHGNRSSDEAIAAFLETSGKSLKKLSLNNASKVGCHTAMSLAKHCRGLLSLDLSWCRRVTNEALGLIVDCCSSLKLLKLFGCTKITDVFLNGHSNTQLQIVGLSNTPLLKFLDHLQPEELLLRYSETHLTSNTRT